MKAESGADKNQSPSSAAIVPAGEHPFDTPPWPKPTVMSWLMSAPFALIFIVLLYTFEALQIVCGWISPKAALWSRAVLQRGFLNCLRCIGAWYDLQSVENLDTSKPYILVSNHQSMFDIPLLYIAFLPIRPRYIAKLELGRKVPTISRYLRTDGSALIDRNNPRQSLPAIKDLALRASKEKFAVAIFPEGTRARDGALKSFRPTGLKILFQNAPEAIVLPVAIDGSWKFTCNKRGPIPFGVRVSLRVGKPIERDGKSTEEMVQECEDRVRQMLREIRADGC